MHPRDALNRPGPKVVVSGLGLMTALGPTRESTWAALRDGRSSARRLEREQDGRPHLGCPVELADRIRREDAPVEPAHAILQVLADEAMADARLGRAGSLPRRAGCAGHHPGSRPAKPALREEGPDPFYDPSRSAVLVGLSKGGIRNLARLHRLMRDPSADPAEVAALWGIIGPEAGADLVARAAGFEGPRLAMVAACATGLVAVLRGADLIRRGDCDVALVGSADASLEPIVLAAFRKMKVLAHDDEPARAIRPWDRRRSGFLVGEGGALLVLERAEGAEARGVVPYAEVAGGALGSDAHHETDLNPDPSGLALVIRRALDDARIRPEAIDHVNLHGTATRANDPIECRALRLALGPAADRVACSANKSQMGHLLGAAGAAEIAIACLSIRDGFVPPTLNLTDPDPACDLDATPLVGRPRAIGAALKLSIGFGGHLAAAVLRKP